MLIREKRRLRLALALGAALVVLLLCVRLAGPALSDVLLGSIVGHLQVDDWIQSHSAYRGGNFLGGSGRDDVSAGAFQPPSSGSGSKPLIGAYGGIAGFAPPNEVRPGGGHPLHTEVFSVSTRDRKFFRIKFGSQEVVQPNIIPHPRAEHLWLAVSQRRRGEGDGDGAVQPEPWVEFVCDAMFIDDALTCIGEDGRGFGEPTHLPVAPTEGDSSKCTPGDGGAIFDVNTGPHDAKLFYGPKDPYIVYGSNSAFTCSGQWIQDLRGLVSPSSSSSSSSSSTTLATTSKDIFVSKSGTELQRPPPYADVETNWFLFWDNSGKPYVHYTLTPRRSFAELHDDGSVGEDLALQSAQHDQQCLKQYMSPLLSLDDSPPTETIYQATNSLAITLCRRPDTSCTPDEDNTFLFAIFQHKTLFFNHVTYHPYAAVFRQRAPFELWGVGSRPIWISGRRTFPNGDTESLSATSISWKGKGQRYHGYVDDVVFLTFTIEGARSGGIDVLAGELLANLGLCSE